MHKEYILLNGFRKAKKGLTAGFHVPLNSRNVGIKMSLKGLKWHWLIGAGTLLMCIFVVVSCAMLVCVFAVVSCVMLMCVFAVVSCVMLMCVYAVVSCVMLICVFAAVSSSPCFCPCCGSF